MEPYQWQEVYLQGVRDTAQRARFALMLRKNLVVYWGLVAYWVKMDLLVNQVIQISGVLIKQKTVTSRKTSSRRSLQPVNTHVPHAMEYRGAIGETIPVGWGLSLSGTLRLDYLLTVVKNFPMMLQRIAERAIQLPYLLWQESSTHLQE